MTSDFSIDTKWEAAWQGPEPVRQTAAMIRIMLSNRVLTRAEDDWSKSVRDEVFLSAYPLALWFASSWWRLCWEPAPTTEPTLRSASWRMAHEMPAVGHGFAWPGLVFESDGENVSITSRPSERNAIEPIRYLEEYRDSVPVSAFEATVTELVDLVLARLDAVSTSDTELASVWGDVAKERHDPGATAYRQLEARLGFDPDEAPEEAVKRLQDLSSEAGDAAVREIAPACSGSDPVGTLAGVIELAQSPGVEGRVIPPQLPSQVLEELSRPGKAPWERGRLLACAVRGGLGLNGDPLGDATLSDVMGVDARAFDPQATASAQPPLGLAVRIGADERLGLLFRRRNRPGRRFEAARFLADSLAAPSADRWFPATDAKTARQKVQRAFAAEFLCPIEALKEYLGGDVSPSGMEDAGEYFGVSPFAIESHLTNNGLLPRCWHYGE